MLSKFIYGFNEFWTVYFHSDLGMNMNKCQASDDGNLPRESAPKWFKRYLSLLLTEQQTVRNLNSLKYAYSGRI
jgi:hypothetical protein